MKMTKAHVRAVNWSVAFILVATGLYVALGPAPSKQRAFKGTLAELLPKPEHLGGWTDAPASLAETPEQEEAVVRILRYDEVVFRTYRSGAQRVSVYAAYWLPGKAPFGDVHEHTPDACWVVNGWSPKEQMDQVRLPSPTGAALLPARQRVFELGGQVEHVVFWHLVNGSVANAPLTNFAPNRYVTTFLRRQPRYEQLFIRVSSNLPIESIWATPPINEIIRQFGFLKDAGPGGWESF